jgi:pyruvate/2-oxoglutarate dehydrogenase complex dihydrolipoamide dehydrogenase (E3) component
MAKRGVKNYHLIVIGAGSGGLVCAAGAAGLGAKVALIEKSKMGGDCLNTGCVPSKAIIRAAKLRYDAKRSRDFGLKAAAEEVNLAEVMASVREVQTKIAPHDSQERFEGLGVDVYRKKFSFISPFEVSDGENILRAKRIVLATGSSPAVPDIPGLANVAFRNSENIWDLEELPQRLVVLGGGPIGCELAQTFSRLGSKVILVQRSRLLSREDPEVSEFLKEIFEEEGIQLRLGWRPREVIKDGEIKAVLLHHPDEGEEKIYFDEILVALGRKPNTEGLQLETGGVKVEAAKIPVDSYLRTSTKHIYACGDVTGPFLFTHTADHQARTVLRNALFPGKSKINYQVIPWSTFTDPEVARLGMSEIEAMEKGVAVEVYRYLLTDLDRAVCDREDRGFIKVLTPRGSDKILGVSLVSPHAGDLLPEWILAMSQNIGLKTISNLIHVYPTLSEINKRVAGAFQNSRLTPRYKKILSRYFRWRFG